jgi:hypothetical protein
LNQPIKEKKHSVFWEGLHFGIPGSFFEFYCISMIINT